VIGLSSPEPRFRAGTELTNGFSNFGFHSLVRLSASATCAAVIDFASCAFAAPAAFMPRIAAKLYNMYAVTESYGRSAPLAYMAPRL
jgi:hypothetical protein